MYLNTFKIFFIFSILFAFYNGNAIGSSCHFFASPTGEWYSVNELITRHDQDFCFIKTDRPGDQIGVFGGTTFHCPNPQRSCRFQNLRTDAYCCCKENLCNLYKLK
uniref:Activin_recp domain-containing protein n=1 Tax=Parastrongyloides trichosuri TaxID=131310 RepID=A0A0N4ZJN8_PARTI